jgi:hypothetical protein
MTIMSDDLIAEAEAPEAPAAEAAHVGEETPAAPEAEMPAEPLNERPGDIPEKFWDAETGTLRADALLKSYRELERKLGQMLPAPAGEDDQDARRRLERVLGVPERAEDYAIEPRHELVTPDPELNTRLHEAGFTRAQAQLVYDLAAERLLPLVEEAVGEVERGREAERLAERFGGPEAFRATARQLATWGKANLSPEVYEALSASYDGVLALHKMMQAEEPGLVGGDGQDDRLDEATLQGMMRDPRYWRDRDPAFIARVTEGFKRLFPS